MAMFYDKASDFSQELFTFSPQLKGGSLQFSRCMPWLLIGAPVDLVGVAPDSRQGFIYYQGA